MTNPLSSKQLIFCREYFAGKTATQAAIEAGYAFRSAVVTASRLLTKANIAAHLAELQAKADDASVASVLERKQILSEMARGRLAQFVTDELTPKMADSAALAELFTIVVEQKDGTQITQHKVKLVDRAKAIDLLNKMERVYGEMGISIDNRTVSITVASPAGEGMVRRIMAGEGTGLVIEEKKE